MLTDTQTARLATVAHDGLARTIRPVHTMYDGDVIFALATGESGSAGGDAMLRLGTATVRAVERAVLNAVLHAASAGGLPAAGDTHGG
ncbi:MAG: P1 family peptidase [Chloroflexia bacterium]